MFRNMNPLTFGLPLGVIYYHKYYVRLPGNLRSNDEGADTVIWLALQPKEKLVPGDFYFDRAEAPKHLKFAGTAASHAQIGSIVDSVRSICGLAANS